MTTNTPSPSRSKLLIAALVAVIAVVAVVVALMGSSSSSTSAAQYVAKGVAAQRHGEYRKATIFYADAIRKNSHDAIAYYDLGTAEQRLNHPGLASIHYKLALRYDPKFSRAWYNLGTILKNINYKKAEGDFRKAIAINPGFAIAHLNLGLTMVKHGDRVSGINQINLALTENSKLISSVPASLRSSVH